MTYRELIDRMHAEPFRPFRIKLSESRKIDVLEPRPGSIGDTRAIFPTEVFLDRNGYPVARQWQTIAIADIIEIVDFKPRRKRKRKSR